MVPLHRGIFQLCQEGSQVAGRVLVTCNEGCHRSANMEDVLDIDDKRLSSNDE